MNLEWKIRLIDRLVKNNPDATIKDYMNIVDGGEDYPYETIKISEKPREEKHFENKKLYGKFSGDFKLRKHDFSTNGKH